MNKQLRRRLFLTTLAGLGLIAAGAGIAVWPLAAEQRLKRLLRSRLGYLKISDEVIQAFTNDYMKDPEHRFDHFRTITYPGQRMVYGYEMFADHLPIFRFERFVISSFLLSTDFFQEGAQVDRPLRYLRYNDRYSVGCGNPFARV